MTSVGQGKVQSTRRGSRTEMDGLPGDKLAKVDWQATKVAAAEGVDPRNSKLSTFTKFMQDPISLKFIKVAIDFFVVWQKKYETTVQLEAIANDVSPEAKQESRRLIQQIEEYTEEMKEPRKGLASAYSVCLLKFSNPTQTQLDSMFWEGLYQYVMEGVATVLGTQYIALMREEFGIVVRTPVFNISKRDRINATKPQKFLTSRELYNLRYHTDPYTASKVLSKLHPRRKAEEGIHTVLHKRSPLLEAKLPSAKVDYSAASPLKKKPSN